jgi:succinate dehydrogenase flavin-adding protein (antitoxin of CptAB toxin-antitoxin module)
MAKEESKLVETVEESTETTTEQKENGVDEKFNPLAFTEDVELKDLITEEKEELEETKEEEKEEEDDDSWKWAKDTEETKEEEKEEENYDWDDEKEEVIEEKSSEESPKEDIEWKKVAEELGVMGSSKEEILESINAYIQQNTQSTPDGQIAEFKKYLNFSDRDLVGEELKADGMDAAEIEESLDKLEDAGMMKMKAKSIRRLINNAIETQTENHKKSTVQEESKRKENANKAREALKGHIKNMDDFMGGKVTKKQKEEVYKFATKRMMDEIWSSHANVADVAMFMLYRKQIEKILRSQGLEDGKAAIMDSIVSPNLNSGKSKSNFKVKSGKFDPKAFMTE